MKWIYAIQTKFVTVCELLNEKHPLLLINFPHDDNAYILDRIDDHHIVIACLLKGRYDIAFVVSVTKDMLRSFEFIRIELMIDIEGGTLSDKYNIRLENIVIDCSMKKKGDVVSYNFDKAVQDREFERTGFLNSLLTILLIALIKLSADHERKNSYIIESIRLIIIKNSRLREKYQHSGAEHDRLYESNYTHREGDYECEIDYNSISSSLLRRLRRELDPNESIMYYDLIASANKLIKDAIARDRLIKEYNILCFEMKATELMNNFPCVVIRDICDYSDSHKNDAWQEYATVSTISYVKELLDIISKH